MYLLVNSVEYNTSNERKRTSSASGRALNKGHSMSLKDAMREERQVFALDAFLNHSV